MKKIVGLFFLAVSVLSGILSCLKMLGVAISWGVALAPLWIPVVTGIFVMFGMTIFEAIYIAKSDAEIAKKVYKKYKNENEKK